MVVSAEMTACEACSHCASRLDRALEVVQWQERHSHELMRRPRDPWDLHLHACMDLSVKP